MLFTRLLWCCCVWGVVLAGGLTLAPAPAAARLTPRPQAPDQPTVPALTSRPGRAGPPFGGQAAPLLGAGAAGSLLTALAGLVFYRRRRRQLQAQAQQVRQEAKRVLEAEEQDRRQTGAALHNGVGQLLSAAKMHLSALEQRLPLPTDEQRALLHTAIESVDESVREVRQLSYGLLPSALSRQGLLVAVRELVARLPPAPPRVQVAAFGLDHLRFEPLHEALLFRAIHELVLHSVRHAQATELMLQLIGSASELTVMLEDNGIGLRPDAAGSGLPGVASRVAYLGGQLTFDASPGRGTTTTLQVPLPGPAA